MSHTNGLLAPEHVLEPERASTQPRRLRGDLRLLYADTLGRQRRESPYQWSLEELVEHFASAEQLENPDVIVPFSAIRATESGDLLVPDVGACTLTAWASAQVGKMFGVRADRWFESASGTERAEELNRRFARTEGEVRVRTSRTHEGSSIVRALVSPTYSPISDAFVTRAIARSLRDVTPVGVLRSHVTDRTTTVVLGIGEPLRAGGAAEVGECYAAIVIRNSGTGYCTLSADPLLHRLVCRNGLVISEPGARFLNVRHAHVALESIETAIARGVAELADRAARTAKRLENASDHPVDEIHTTVQSILRGARLPLRRTADVLRAYEQEPHPSRFGVVQALTLAAQGWTPEERMITEAAAGRYLVETGS